MTKKIRVTLYCRIFITIFSASRAQGETLHKTFFLRMQKNPSLLHSALYLADS